MFVMLQFPASSLYNQSTSFNKLARSVNYSRVTIAQQLTHKCIYVFMPPHCGRGCGRVVVAVGSSGKVTSADKLTIIQANVISSLNSHTLAASWWWMRAPQTLAHWRMFIMFAFAWLTAPPLTAYRYIRHIYTLRMYALGEYIPIYV